MATPLLLLARAPWRIAARKPARAAAYLLFGRSTKEQRCMCSGFSCANTLRRTWGVNPAVDISRESQIRIVVESDQQRIHAIRPLADVRRLRTPAAYPAST